MANAGRSWRQAREGHQFGARHGAARQRVLKQRTRQRTHRLQAGVDERSHGGEQIILKLIGLVEHRRPCR
jgi:hypothetical protein